MKTLDVIRCEQRDYIKHCEFKTKRFLNSLELDSIDIVLISGSVARGDSLPGKFGGMIDITTVKSLGSNKTAEEIFGKDEDPDIPYHCVRYLGQWFQILYSDHTLIDDFHNLSEARKFAILESKVVIDRSNQYSNFLQEMEQQLPAIFIKEREKGLETINYLLSDYKVDRWKRREAYPQLHMNLNRAIEVAVKCLFYKNNQFAPAEDRRLYYSYTLESVDKNFPYLISTLYKQDITSLKDYYRREKLFQTFLTTI